MKSEDIEIKPCEQSSPPVTTKGYGLKKWRRIQRELSKDGSGNLDTSKTLKRGLSIKNVVNSVQSGVKGKNWTEAIKMLREGVKIEKEKNSHSSVESDSRSSNFVFVQGARSGTNCGKQSGISTNCNRDSSNVGELEDHGQEDLVHGSWEVNGEKVKNHSSSKDIDPLVDSIFTLQTAQEALQREIQELRGIGAIAILDSLNHGSNLRSDSDQLHTGENAQNSTHFLGKEVMKSLKQNVGRLESRIEEANALLKVKDTEVVELEYAIKCNESTNEESRSSIESRWKEHIQMESELEDLFKQKIEAEVEYLTISRTIPKMRVAAVNQVAIGQPRIFNELGDAESKPESLKRQAESSKTSYADIVETDQVLKLRKRMCKFASFFFAQFMLLFLVFLVFLLQLSPHYAGVVPT